MDGWKFDAYIKRIIRRQNNQDYNHYCHFKANTDGVALRHTRARSKIFWEWGPCDWRRHRAGRGWILGTAMISAAFLSVSMSTCVGRCRAILYYNRNKTKKSKIVKSVFGCFLFKAVVPSELKINVCVGALTRLSHVPCLSARQQGFQFSSSKYLSALTVYSFEGAASLSFFFLHFTPFYL